MKPCPFCNSENLEVLENKNLKRFFVECDSCWATGPAENDKHDAIRSWDDCFRGERISGKVTTILEINGECFTVSREFEK